jgi:hypothetical protein
MHWVIRRKPMLLFRALAHNVALASCFSSSLYCSAVQSTEVVMPTRAHYIRKLCRLECAAYQSLASNLSTVHYNSIELYGSTEQCKLLSDSKCSRCTSSQGGLLLLAQWLMTAADDMHFHELCATSYTGSAVASVLTRAHQSCSLISTDALRAGMKAAGCVAYRTHEHTAVLLAEHVVDCYCRHSTTSDDMVTSSVAQQLLVCSQCSELASFQALTQSIAVLLQAVSAGLTQSC